MKLISHPQPWNSVHRPIEYVYDYDVSTTGIEVTDMLGAAKLTVFRFNQTPQADDIIYIADGPYRGAHVVVDAEVTGIVCNIVIDAPYVGDATGFTVKIPEPIPQMELHAGYLANEEYPDELPNTLVARFTPENSPEFQIRFDVSEYLKSIFRIQPPVEGIDFSMFNRFRLRFGDTYKDSFMALNASIKTAELNARHVDTLAPLHSHVPPIVFSCGKTLISYLTANVVLNKTVTDTADITGFGRYNPDYSNDFNIV